MNPIEIRGLKKNYSDFEAIRGIDFEVAPDEVFGLRREMKPHREIRH